MYWNIDILSCSLLQRDDAPRLSQEGTHPNQPIYQPLQCSYQPASPDMLMQGAPMNGYQPNVSAPVFQLQTDDAGQQPQFCPQLPVAYNFNSDM